MHKILQLIVLSLLLGLNFSCGYSRYHTDEQYNPQTQQIEKTSYSDYYQLKTSLLDQQLQLVLVTNVDRQATMAMYHLKKNTRRLLPNDYMLPSEVNLNLKNSSDKPINMELLAVNIESRNLPHSQRTVTVPAKGSVSLHLGQVPVDIRLLSLYTTIEYITNEHREEAFEMKRLVHYDQEKATDKK